MIYNKKRILIIGPIGDFGGRELEAGFVAKSLVNDFEVSICSTGDITKKSQVFDFVKKHQVTSIKELAFKNNFILRVTSFLSYLKNKRKYPMFFYSTNKLNKKFLKADEKIKKQIRNVIDANDLVFICAQLSSNYIEEIINYAQLKNKPILFRTTGAIRTVSKKEFKYLKKVTKFIHHSEVNASNLNKQISLPYMVIDQCAFNEASLLELPILTKKPLVYGYLGRLAEEKGIVQFLQKSNLEDVDLIIAGDGDLKLPVLKLIKNYPNVKYIGKLEHKELAYFFNKIDVIVIPSIEESGPLVALEAMAAGKLIIATDVGAMKERLAGLKSYWFNIEGTNKKLYSLFEQFLDADLNDLTEQKEQLRQRYKDNYAMKIISYKYLELVKKNCASRF